MCQNVEMSANITQWSQFAYFSFNNAWQSVQPTNILISQKNGSKSLNECCSLHKLCPISWSFWVQSSVFFSLFLCLSFSSGFMFTDSVCENTAKWLLVNTGFDFVNLLTFFFFFASFQQMGVYLNRTSFPSGDTIMSCGFSKTPSFGPNLAVTLFVCILMMKPMTVCWWLCGPFTTYNWPPLTGA